MFIYLMLGYITMVVVLWNSKNPDMNVPAPFVIAIGLGLPLLEIISNFIVSAVARRLKHEGLAKGTTNINFLRKWLF